MTGDSRAAQRAALSRTRALLLVIVLGAGWMINGLLGGSSEAGQPTPEEEGYVLAGEVDGEEIWLRHPEDATERAVLREGDPFQPEPGKVQYRIVGDLSCRGLLELPRHEVWQDPGDWHMCANTDGEPGPADVLLIASVPAGTTAGVFEVRHGVRLPFTPLAAPPDWRMAVAVTVQRDSLGVGSVAAVLPEPVPEPPADTLEALAALPEQTGLPVEPWADYPIGGSAVLGTARVGEDLLVFHLRGRECGLLVVPADSPERILLDMAVPPPGLDERSLPEKLPGGPYSTQSLTSDHGSAWAEVSCGERDMVVSYIPNESDATLGESAGAVAVVSDASAPHALVLAVGTEERRAALADHYAGQGG
jgi:hypothetical protein